MTKFTATYYGARHFWEVHNSASRLWYRVRVTPDGWSIKSSKSQEISPTGKLGRSIIAAVEAAILQQSSDTLMALALIDESLLNKRES